MHGPQKVTFTNLASGATTVGIRVSYRGKNATFNVGVLVTQTLAQDGTIQVTLDDPADFDSVGDWNTGADWAPLADGVLTGVVDAFAGTITTNCYGVRYLNANAAATTGSLTVLQD